MRSIVTVSTLRRGERANFQALSRNDAVKIGSATVSVAPRRRLADWPPVGKTTHPSVNLLRPSNAFGGTSKAAGEDARASQSYCMVTA
jgi:hypothetical protein